MSRILILPIKARRRRRRKKKKRKRLISNKLEERERERDSQHTYYVTQLNSAFTCCISSLEKYNKSSNSRWYGAVWE
jgi:hypothetical protein